MWEVMSTGSLVDCSEHVEEERRLNMCVENQLLWFDSHRPLKHKHLNPTATRSDCTHRDGREREGTRRNTENMWTFKLGICKKHKKKSQNGKRRQEQETLLSPVWMENQGNSGDFLFTPKPVTEAQHRRGSSSSQDSDVHRHLKDKGHSSVFFEDKDLSQRRKNVWRRSKGSLV